MILEIEDYNGNTLCALSLSELRENINDIEINNTIGNVSIADIDFDDIFGTNDRKVRIQLENINNRNKTAEEIVDYIISTREGLIYDEDILCEYVNDYYENEMNIIRTIVDEMMKNHLEEDNLTIKF